MSEPRFINANQVKQYLTMPDAIAAMRLAFADLSSGSAMVPERQPVHTAGATHYLVMPAHYPSGNITMVKSVSLNAENPSRGMPFIQAYILAFDDETGRPLAMIDGSEVTAIRTAAASGLATDLFANPESKVGAIFGTGALARPHLEALLTVRDFQEILVFGRAAEKAEAFCEQWQPDVEVRLVPQPAWESLRTADVICTATTSKKPLFEHHMLKPGVHINAVGVYQPDAQEVPAETVAESNVFIDQMESALMEAGDLLVPMSKGLFTKSHFEKEIGEVLLAKYSYRWNQDQVSLFKSVGNAIQDAAAVDVILQNAKKDQ